MKRFKPIISVSLILALTVITFTGCYGNAEKKTSNDSYTIKIAHSMAPEHSYNAASEKFKEIVEKKTDGRINVEVYPNSQLGGERETIEAVQAGTLEMVMTGTSAMSGFVPEWQVFDMAYLFKDYDEFWKVMKSGIGEKFCHEYSEEKGFRGLGIGCMGTRNVHSVNKPVYDIGDMKGLKIRVMESNVHIKSFKAMGAAPVTMAFSELFTALEQGTVDAEESVPSAAYTSKTYEICNYYSLTEHFWLPCCMFMSEKFFQTLSEEDQALVEEAGAEAMEYQWQYHEKEDKEKLQIMKDAGTKVNEVKDKKPFIKAAHSVYNDILEDVPHGEETMEEMGKMLGRDMHEVF